MVRAIVTVDPRVAVCADTIYEVGSVLCIISIMNVGVPMSAHTGPAVRNTFGDAAEM